MEIKLPDISDALKPLPRLKSLVQTELENIGKKAPIDKKVFVRAFAGAFGFLILVAITLPYLTTKHSEPPKVADVMAVAKPAAPAPSLPQQRAIEVNDTHSNDPLLPPAPVKELEEALGDKTIPMIAADGRKAFSVYARPFDKADMRPRIALVIAELGLSQQTSQAAINDLPGSVTLVFSNFAREPDAWMARAREKGHELLLSIPMEPLDYPMSDPGPDTLLSHNSDADNKVLLLKHLTNGKGYIGITSISGTQISTAPDKLKPILDEVKKRGLMWLDPNLTPMSVGTITSSEVGLPSAKANLHINDSMSTNSINQVLADAENDAAKTGHSVVLIEPSPLGISALRAWAKTLPDKHIALAPLSAVIK